MPDPTRRELFKVAAPLAVGAALPAVAAEEPHIAELLEPSAQLIVRMFEPRNLEVPVSELAKQPTILVELPLNSGVHFVNRQKLARHFVRSHFAVPQLDAKTFTLTIDGHVEKPVTLTLADLQKMKKVVKTLTIECAGNGRIFLVPQVRGLQWAFGGVSEAN